jgi:glycerol uptake facilitator-like aquaporin
MAKKATTSTKRTTKTKSTAKATASPAKKATTTTVTRSSAAASSRPAWWAAFTRKAPATRTSVGSVIAEFVGTFMFAGVVLAASGQPIIILFGLAAIYLAVAHLSGAHLNPAITFAAWASRYITATRMAAYIVAQVLGGMLAYVVLNWFLKGTVDASAAMLGQATELFKVAPLTEGKEWYAFLAEMLGAAVLGFGYANVLSGARRGYAAAYTVAGSLFVAMVLAGKTAILNPAVAVAVGGIDFTKAVLWPFAVWAIAAAVGAALGFYLYRFVQHDVTTTK